MDVISKSLPKKLLTKKFDKNVHQIIEKLYANQNELLARNEELVKTQLELEKVNSKYKALYELSPISYFILDKHGIVNDVNAAGTTLFGIEKNNFIKKNFLRFIMTEDQTVFESYRLTALKTCSPQIFELKFIRWNACFFYGLVEFRVVDGCDEHEKSLLLSIINIHEKKLNYEELQLLSLKIASLERMQTWDESLTDIIDRQSHFLTLINNYLHGSIKKMESQQFNAADIVKKLTQVLDYSDQLIKIVKKIRNFSINDLMDYQPISFEKIIKNAIELIQFETIKYPTLINFECNNELPLIKADALHILQVILHLLRNAIEAMKIANTVEPKIFLEIMNLNNGMLEFSIRDNGPGFSQEVATKMYAPYFSTKITSIGLGLTISKKIIELHNGQLSASINDFGGAIFKFTIPTAEIKK